MFIKIVIIDINRVVLRNRYETRSERSWGVAFNALREYYFVVDGVTVRLPKDIYDLMGGCVEDNDSTGYSFSAEEYSFRDYSYPESYSWKYIQVIPF